MSRPSDFVSQWWPSLHALASEYGCRPSDIIYGGWGPFNWDLAILNRVMDHRAFEEMQRKLAELRKRGEGIE